jgi:predicted MFS family arabinose efflux permease
LRRLIHAERDTGRGIGLAVALLAAGETLVWAGLFYSFAALLLAWEADLGWVKSDLMLGFTLAILTSAVFAPLFGKLIDAGHGRWVLTGGAIAGAVLLTLLAQVTERIEFITIWMLIGAAQAACLYEPCFAFVTKNTGASSRWAITRITLVAGFASTLAFPAAAYLAEAYGWRLALITFAVVIALLAAPMMFVGALLLERAAPDGLAPHQPGVNRAAVKTAMRRVEFWLLAALFSFISLNHAMLLSHILPVIVDRGATAAQAVFAAMLIGPAQVAGRVVMMRLEKRVSVQMVTLWAISGGILAALVLLLAGVFPALVFVFVVLQGAAFGVISILRQVMVAEILGRTAFGAIASRIAVPFLISAATAPYIGAVLWRFGGYNLVVLTALGFVSMALILLLILRRYNRA